MTKPDANQPTTPDSPPSPDAGGNRQTRQRQRRRTQRASAFSKWRARQVTGHPEAIAALHLLPPRTYASEQGATTVAYDGLGFFVPPASTVRQERLIEVLHLLGRVALATSDMLFTALYARRFDLRTTYRDLSLLRTQRLVWSAPPDGGNFHGTPLRRHQIYGLTHEGKQLLINLGVITDSESLEQMHACAWRTTVPRPNQLMHDLQIAWWCLSVREGLRLLPWCVGVRCQVEPRIFPGQRPDAILSARFDVSQPRMDLPLLPWMARTPCPRGMLDLHWALEVDNSTEAIAILQQKFEAYRDRHANGTYQEHLGGELIPIFLIQNATRSATLSASFKQIWPGGWALVSTPGLKGANASPFGALWGHYRSMAQQQIVPLLSTLQRDATQRVIGFRPLMTEALWRRYLDHVRAHTPPYRLADLLAREQDTPVASDE
ncbi:MAG: hypothetical protein EI684_10145 [Candidatus Viridilinea halotolerans]|uniref:Uncharacterized protein n=1 Tax=Candidatus Viridilinea halotolerans TaxID=2491704 RepID=A0A426U0F8_9CHLR|nr:MAG: hypothetical protein EI684_10145 [Candidatus Viridilinea halotolerans]